MKVNDKPRDRPSVASVIPLVHAIYQRHAAGCCLHLITDDDNYEQEHADWCMNHARERGHSDCIAAMDIIAQFTDTQRHALYKRYREYAQ